MEKHGLGAHNVSWEFNWKYLEYSTTYSANWVWKGDFNWHRFWASWVSMYFDAVVVEVKTFLLLFRLPLAILCSLISKTNPYYALGCPWDWLLWHTYIASWIWPSTLIILALLLQRVLRSPLWFGNMKKVARLIGTWVLQGVSYWNGRS